jgi:glutamate N-acetyltransferase/amino-acid N-acetyltransferase
MHPKGFLFSAVEAAIKTPGRKDLALIYSETDAVMAGTFTANRVKAAPVKLSMKRVKSGKGRAVIINSGNANACTGKKGMSDAQEMTSLVASYLNIPESLVYACSTGVIGVLLPMKKIKPKIKALVKDVGNAGIKDVAEAIMTTDTFPKLVSRKLKIGGREGVISGICKGAGMIRPNMATMLAFILTDIAVEKDALGKALKEAVENSFNRITVEGDMSTNDTVLAMANGMLGNPAITTGARHYGLFKKALSEVTYELSRLIIKDAEGATKFIEIEVKGARTESEARKCAFAIANSVLVKTAVYGSDPNVGRIMAALGYSGVDVKEEKTDVYIGKVKVINKGVSTDRQKEARKELKKKEVRIAVELHSGRAKTKVLTSDLTEEFVRFNAEYTT